MPDAAHEVDAGVRTASPAASSGLGVVVDEARIAAAAAAAVLRCVVDARGPAADVEAAMLMRTPLMPPLRPLLRLLPLGPSRLRLRLRLRLLPPLRPPLRCVPLVPLWPAMSLLLPLCLGGRVPLPPGGLPKVARTARAARRSLAGPSSSPRSPKPMRGPPWMGSVLPLLATPMTPMILPALTFEGRPRRALLLPPVGLLWYLVWWQPQEERLLPSARLGFAGLATPAAASSTLSPWLRTSKEPAGE